MNLFIIPSWYPNHVQPLAGIFTREQAEAIADLAPNIRVVISAWGHEAGYLWARDLSKSFDALKWRFRQRGYLALHERNRVHECFNPALSWSHHLPFGGAKCLINVNRKNLQLAIKRFGAIDLIHAHVCYPAGYIASVLSREFGIPYVVTEHMSPFPFPSLMRRGEPVWEIEQAFKGAARTIAVSQSLAKRISSFGYREPVVIPNMVDERRFALGPPCAKKFVFLTLCGLNEQKGIDHLLQAIAAWNPPVDHFEFRIGGDGPLRAKFETLAIRLGIADRVRWLGAVTREQAPELFRDCHVYVMPSRHETFGVVYAEAIASGKPIIATRCGGPEDIVNETNGRLIDVGEIDVLAEQMAAMVKNWKKYSAQDIRNDFLRRFSRQAVVGQLVTLYEGALGRG